MLTIFELSNQTGLKIGFIRKCLKVLKPILEPYIKRGDNNSLLLDSNGLVIFDQIKQLKEQNLAVPEIKIQLEKAIQSQQNPYTQPVKTPAQTIKTGDNFDNLQNKIYELYEQINTEKEKHLKDITEKNKLIISLEREKNLLESTIKLLPEGKTPEQIKQDYEQEQKRKMEVAMIIGELKNTGFFGFRKRKKLIKNLRDRVLMPEQPKGQPGLNDRQIEEEIELEIKKARAKNKDF